MKRLGTHPNVAGALLVSLGCESFNRKALREEIENSGRPVNNLIIQQTGGTRSTIDAGLEWVLETQASSAKQPTVDMNVDELVVATICGGSDGTSGISANPAVGRSFDKLLEQGATCIFE